MNIKKLEIATRILADLKKLDAEIIEIEKFAMKIANGQVKSSFTLNLYELGKRHKEDKVSFDEDGSLVRGNRPDIMSRFMRSHFPPNFIIMDDFEEEKPSKDKLKYELSDTTTLQVLGVILGEKTTIRSKMIKQLNRYGISI